MRVRFKATAGPHRVGATFLATQYAPLLDLDRHFRRSTIQTGPTPGYSFFPHVGTIRIEGPFNATPAVDSPSRRRVLLCKPARAADEMPCARRILGEVATRAFRRPATDADVDLLMEFYQEGRSDKDFEVGIETALSRILASPQFIYRIEEEPPGLAPGQTYRISDIDLASRLSFFLWSGPPDDALLAAARQRRLNDPVVLEQQVRRMLKHPRARALTANFAGQWLNLRGLDSVVPLASLYPDFDDPLRQAMRTEVELLFDSIIREDRRVIDLLTADYTFVNERLARHYGIPNVYGSQFRRVDARSRNGGPTRAARQGRIPDDHLEARTHVAGDARQVDHDQHPRHEPAGSAARRAAAAAARDRRARQRDRAVDAREDARASRAPRLRAVPPADGSDRVLARELRRDRTVAQPRRRHADRCVGGSLRRHEGVRCGRAAAWLTGYSEQFVRVTMRSC